MGATELGPNRDRDPFKSVRRAPPACGETVVLSTCLDLGCQLQSCLDVAAAVPKKRARHWRTYAKDRTFQPAVVLVPFPA